MVNIHVPPLREREGDINLLSNYFLNQKLKSSSKEVIGFTDEALENLEKYNWPGNVRELENVVERAVALVKGDLITTTELPPSIQSGESSAYSFHDLSLTEAKQNAIDQTEKKYLLYLLKKYNGNVTKIAEEANMTRRNIHRMLNRHSLDPNSWRVS